MAIEQIKMYVHRNARCKDKTKNPNRQAIRKKNLYHTEESRMIGNISLLVQRFIYSENCSIDTLRNESPSLEQIHQGPVLENEEILSL